MTKGLLIVYTGNGKGKTTAALGLALRMMGHGSRVCLLQFIKSRDTTGESKISKQLGSLYTCHVLGQGFIIDEKDIEKNRVVAEKAWDFAKKIITDESYKLIILDEVTYLVSLHLLDESDVMDTLLHRPRNLHIVVTGRNAPLSFIEKADLVTEMHEVKHPFSEGTKAIKGIEW